MDPTRRSLAAGASVLVEKPLALDLTGADQILDAGEPIAGLATRIEMLGDAGYLQIAEDHGYQVLAGRSGYDQCLPSSTWIWRPISGTGGRESERTTPRSEGWPTRPEHGSTISARVRPATSRQAGRRGRCWPSRWRSRSRFGRAAR